MKERPLNRREGLGLTLAAAVSPPTVLAKPKAPLTHVALHVAELDDTAAAALRDAARRAHAGDHFKRAAAAGVEQLVLGLKPTRPGRVLAVTYALSAGPLSPPQVLAEALTPSGQAEAMALETLTSQPAAEQLMHWEDDQRAVSDRGAAISTLSVMTLDEAGAAEMRDLVTELKRRHLDGLALRARAVGYYREAMALRRQPTGEWLFLLYLEVADPEMRPRLQAYPDDAFTTWWNPPFRRLVAAQFATAPSETVLNWSAANAPPPTPG